MRVRSVRAGAEWEAAETAAAEQGETLADVIRRALQDYAADWETRKVSLGKYVHALQHHFPDLSQGQALEIVLSAKDSLPGEGNHMSVGTLTAYARGWLGRAEP
jgi:hypothetical protein